LDKVKGREENTEEEAAAIACPFIFIGHMKLSLFEV